MRRLGHCYFTVMVLWYILGLSLFFRGVLLLGCVVYNEGNDCWSLLEMYLMMSKRIHFVESIVFGDQVPSKECSIAIHQECLDELKSAYHFTY